MAASSTSTPNPAAAKKFEKPRRLKWHHHVAAFLIFLALRTNSATWRLQLVDPRGVLRPGLGSFIAAVWHNRLALSMPIWQRFARPTSSTAGLVALISASHDGGMLARALGYFGVQAVRGSSSRRGAQALLELTSWTDRGYSVAITPDGPRGPCYRVHDGILALAQVSGLPIIPFAARVHWKLRLRSWDRFQIPLPFTKCEIFIGEPIVIPRDATDEQREQLREELRARLLALTHDD